MTQHKYAVPGFEAVGVCAGIKSTGALDLALITSRTPCCAAAVFTQNAFPAAPVCYDQRLLAFNREKIHGVLINSGCANACTGVAGDANAKLMAESLEQALETGDQTVFVMSTGVIGVQLPIDKITEAVPPALDGLNARGWRQAAEAIMTTDTRPKLATRQVEIDGVTVTLTGMAKGAGMIHPDMATMLSVIATDAAVAPKTLQDALADAVRYSFNRISIDGDTSTNDTVLLLANGAAGHAEINGPGDAYRTFVTALTDLSTELAQAIVRDGEGATKFVSIHVCGAQDDAAAHQAANTIATSPLVKTAFFGSDANWGRLLAALGRAGIRVSPATCDLFVDGGPVAGELLGELQLVAAGEPTDYAEADAAARFAQPELDVRITLGLGPGSATVWTSDLSHDYVTINGDYRT
jgi:glutamate N-acetyltransferase/amino-acid N-acetyltransferase